MFNRVIFMGRLTADPELKSTQNGIQVCRFSIAVNRKVQKGKEEQTDFFNATCWRSKAEFVCNYFHKGQMIHVEGTMQNDNYTDQNGVKHYGMVVNAENIDFCGDKPAGGKQQPYQPYQGQPQQPYQGQPQQPYQGQPQQPYQGQLQQPYQGQPQQPYQGQPQQPYPPEPPIYPYY